MQVVNLEFRGFFGVYLIQSALSLNSLIIGGFLTSKGTAKKKEYFFKTFFNGLLGSWNALRAVA